MIKSIEYKQSSIANLIGGNISLGFIDNKVFPFHAITVLPSELFFGHVNLKVRNQITSVPQHLHNRFSDPKEPVCFILR